MSARETYREETRRRIVGNERCFYCGRPATARGECIIGGGMKDGREARDIGEFIRDHKSFGTPVAIVYFTCAEDTRAANEYFLERTGTAGGYTYEENEDADPFGPAYERLDQIVKGIPSLMGLPEEKAEADGKRKPSRAEIRLAAIIRRRADKRRGVKTPEWIRALSGGRRKERT